MPKFTYDQKFKILDDSIALTDDSLVAAELLGIEGISQDDLTLSKEILMDIRSDLERLEGLEG